MFRSLLPRNCLNDYQYLNFLHRVYNLSENLVDTSVNLGFIFILTVAITDYYI